MHNNEEKEDYLTATSKLAVLESALVFTDYTITVNDIEEKTKILGVSAYEKKDNIIMFTHNNHIYVGQESEVLIYMCIYSTLFLTIFCIDT